VCFGELVSSTGVLTYSRSYQITVLCVAGAEPLECMQKYFNA
jgi:hypothetical protein